jgi:hypothetical protein
MVKSNTDFKKRIHTNYDFQLPLTLQLFEDFYPGYNKEKLMSLE